ncbi:MAG: glucohydrolase, partial [Erysipelotrichaceae bacterium]|nr:glucohydrolase [Erysipelotrichaceae bacterium]
VNPWININPDYRKYNVESELKDDNSILNYYKKAIKLRKDNECLIYGNFEPSFELDKNMLVYKRTLDDETFVVVMNLTDKTLKKPIVKDVVLSNYNSDSGKLRPYEVIVCKKVERY